jgi:hypothetical protein
MKFGSRLSVAEQIGDQRGLPRLEAFLSDARYAMRGLRRNPALAVIVSQQFAKERWCEESALGKRLRFFEAKTNSPGPWMTVVGLISNIIQWPCSAGIRFPGLFAVAAAAAALHVGHCTHSRLSRESGVRSSK